MKMNGFDLVVLHLHHWGQVSERLSKERIETWLASATFIKT